MRDTAMATRRSNAMPLVAFGLALGASVALLLAPTGERETACFSAVSGSGTASPAGQPPCENRVSHVSLLQEEGVSVVAVLAVPVFIAAAALALQRTRWRRTAALVAGTLLAFLAVLGSASIGLFYLPSAVATFMAASQPREGAVAA